MGWALDSELALTRRLLNFVSFSNLLFCDVIHAVYWPVLLGLPRILLTGKKIISHLTHDPMVAFQLPGFDAISKRVNVWVVRSQRAKRLMEERGLNVCLIPYPIDTDVFYPISKTDVQIRKLVADWSIPSDHYLIGSFQRDTEGSDLQSPKLIKGPDIFADIVTSIWKDFPAVHVVLAGPRRFWLRQRLAIAGVSFSYIGQDVAGDDVRQNTLSHETMNLLYNLIDLYIVSSRMQPPHNAKSSVQG